MRPFRWNDWNRDHATKHGCTISEIELVVRSARRPWPMKSDNEKWVVEGRGQGGRMVRVVYLLSPADMIFVIHAMPLTTRRRR
jgi:uncharacterized DUF497 family protein